MTTDDARVLAQTELDGAQQMNAAHEHPESLKRAKLASVILDLCSQLDASLPSSSPVVEDAPKKPKGKR